MYNSDEEINGARVGSSREINDDNRIIAWEFASGDALSIVIYAVLTGVTSTAQ